ncbi:hypothetical protein ASPCADRAFT_173504 [Aspergillus carbonarius ITEM 5010]|uniref:Cytochrome P450 n=1 Tax=Aspergillus carbonarius (strain ITEM 5010) TaxID=602072 RepID=A0A1R3RGK7_ASPC5|nr:hypothetical protein ASPCADRAFT_173504 [Aspergillus carbonarius ITEM 5010]
MTSISRLVVLVGIAVVILIRRALLQYRRDQKLPPGPPRLPWLGNLHQIPKQKAYLRFTEWSKQYGRLFSLKLGPATAVVITDRRLVKDLLDKKSALYSARPSSFVAQVLITRGDQLLTMNYGDTWRRLRKTVHRHFFETACETRHMRLLEAEHTQMLRDFVVRPDQHMRHPARTTNSIIMSLLYGIRTPSYNTPHVEFLNDLMDRWSKVMEMGATPPVDIFPALHWIPQQWLGCWRDRAVDVGIRMKSLYQSLRTKVAARRQQSAGRAPCFIDGILEDQEKLGLTDNQVDFLGGVMLEGGSDTGSATLQVLIQAMVLHPEVQRHAQAELDAVCGNQRSPVWDDFPRLAYINQVVKETMRWRPISPLGIPHALTEDDWVDGRYFLPRGTTVFLNIWGLHHDTSVYPDPDRFDPDRYEGRTGLAAEYVASADYAARDHYGYGTGRRICPGIHLSERSLFLGAAKLLWAFQFEPQHDAHGVPIPIDTDLVTGYSEGLLVAPRPFSCRVIPRSKVHEEVILREFSEVQRDVFSQYEGA